MTGDELSTLVDRLRRDRRRHPYRGRREYSQTAREVADLAEQLITAGAAGQTVPELRNAVDRITRALMYMDDASGIVGDDLHQIMELYARACSTAPPPPKSLAGWLVKLACDSELERLVEQRAQTVDPQSWSGGFAIRDLREQLAEVSGDLDRYVAVLAEHLTNAHQYKRITLALHAAGRRSEAIDWWRCFWRRATRRPRWRCGGTSSGGTRPPAPSTTHPAEVIGPYQDLIEQHIFNSTDKQRYRRAVSQLPALRSAQAAVGDPAAFDAYLADLRLRHKRRPTFLKTLDTAGW